MIFNTFYKQTVDNNHYYLLSFIKSKISSFIGEIHFHSNPRMEKWYSDEKRIDKINTRNFT